MRYIDIEKPPRHFGLGPEHISFAFEDTIITGTHDVMREFCEDALFQMDERNEPEIDASLIENHEKSLPPMTDDFKTVALAMEKMRDENRCPACGGYGGGTFTQGKGWSPCLECGGDGHK